MSETWKEYIDRHRNDPKERAITEKYLGALGDSKPVKSAYWNAVLRGDETTALIIIIYRDIFRLREAAKQDPWFTKRLEQRIAEVKALEASQRTYTPTSTEKTELQEKIKLPSASPGSATHTAKSRHA